MDVLDKSDPWRLQLATYSGSAASISVPVTEVLDILAAVSSLLKGDLGHNYF